MIYQDKALRVHGRLIIFEGSSCAPILCIFGRLLFHVIVLSVFLSHNICNLSFWASTLTLDILWIMFLENGEFMYRMVHIYFILVGGVLSDCIAFLCLRPVLHNCIVRAHNDVLVLGLTKTFMGKSTLVVLDFLKILGRSVLFRFLVALNVFAVYGEDQAGRTNY